jgi:hypothetical protein
MSKLSRLAALGAATLLLAIVAGNALAFTEVPTTAAVFERVFNDCPISILEVDNSYPTLISISDTKSNCGGGFANRHCWRFSQNGTDPQLFFNNNGFSFGADVTARGAGEGEAGLQISPWWSQLVDGVFNIRTTDGEIACFGGRLPFYSFTAAQAVTYTKGDMIHMEMEYLPNGLSEANPATIEYRLDYGGMMYTSGPLPFDMGNPDENPPYGLWGMLNEATAGGHVQVFLQEGPDDANLTVLWENITFTDLGDVVATENDSWSNVKALYR